MVGIENNKEHNITKYKVLDLDEPEVVKQFVKAIKSSTFDKLTVVSEDKWDYIYIFKTKRNGRNNKKIIENT